MSPSRSGNSLISRRRLLQAGGLGALALGLPGTVAARVAFSNDSSRRKGDRMQAENSPRLFAVSLRSKE